MLFSSNVRNLLWLLAGAAALALAMSGACKKDQAAGEGTGASTEMVVVTKAGTKLDPAVPMARIPDGAWICDMGTVHFAKSEKGEGTCDLCGMPLVQKGAPTATPPVTAPAAAPVSDPPDAKEGGASAEEGTPASNERANLPIQAGSEKSEDPHTGHSH